MTSGQESVQGCFLQAFLIRAIVLYCKTGLCKDVEPIAYTSFIRNRSLCFTVIL